tara:strand:+ start:441 stop:812 length:372 start_codon:yes stop_codon:yes gene_type:complete
MNPTVKSELDFVYITSAGTRYLNRLDALCAEVSIQQGVEFKQQKQERIMDYTEVMLKVFSDMNWGVYYKSEPMHTLNMKEGAALYKINEVDEDEVIKVTERAIEKCLQTKSQSSEQIKNDNTG